MNCVGVMLPPPRTAILMQSGSIASTPGIFAILAKIVPTLMRNVRFLFATSVRSDDGS